MTPTRFGATDLPHAQAEALRKAKRLQVVSLVYVTSCVVLVLLVMGSSQAMKAAWIEDMLSLLPPMSFLIASRLISREPNPEHPYGRHRTIGAAHLASSVALLAMGLFIVGDSGMTLVSAEHPTIGTMHLLGHTFWQGWLMIPVLLYTGVPNMLIGRAKKKLAKTLHDKVLYADATMNADDWLTASGAIVGVLGIGFGVWWLDSAVAILIGASVVKDGIENLSNALNGLLDGRVRTHDDQGPHPAMHEAIQALQSLPWVAEAGVRMRDEGHVFHTEAFVVPRAGQVDHTQLSEARDVVRQVDWKLQDTVIVPVSGLPPEATH